MKPYYDEGGITIYHGDAGELLAGMDWTGPVVTDPPYGSGHYATDVEALTPEMLRRLAAVGPTAVFGYAEALTRLCAAAEMFPSEWVTWWPTNAACRGFVLSGLRREAEHVAVFGKHRFADLRQPRGESSRRILAANYQSDNPLAQRGIESHGEPDTRRLGDVWTDAAPGLGFQSHLRKHPNEKPLALMRRLVEGVSEPDDSVLDPFCGSGTTLRAAKDLGRKAIGIEIEERYCEIAAKRLGQEVLDFGEAA